MLHPKFPSAIAALAGLLLLGCSKEPTETWEPGPELPESVAFTRPGLYPEGVQAAGFFGFLVSSQTRGAIGQVTDAGTYTVFADDSLLVSTIGLRVDEQSGRVLAAVSDPGYNPRRTSPTTRGKLARLAIFNLSNPQSASVILNLGGTGTAANYPAHFANDIAVDNDGNAYVTDSFAPVIYKITRNAVVTVFAEDARFSAPAGVFGLNGIVWHPDGFLLVAKSNTGNIYKIPTANPTAISTVNVGSQNLQGADGLLLLGNELQVVCNAQAKVYKLSTADNWTQATVTGTFTTPPQYPTTLALRRRLQSSDFASYVLYSNLNALQANTQPPVSVFTIAKVKF